MNGIRMLIFVRSLGTRSMTLEWYSSIVRSSLIGEGSRRNLFMSCSLKRVKPRFLIGDRISVSVKYDRGEVLPSLVLTLGGVICMIRSVIFPTKDLKLSEKIDSNQNMIMCMCLLGTKKLLGKHQE